MARRSISSDQEIIVLDEYAKNPDTRFVSNKLGLSYNSVRNCLIRTGKIVLRNVVDDNERQKMVEMYLNGLSTCEIGRTLKRDNDCVAKNLRKAKIKFRSRSNACKIYNIDTTYFKNVNTSEKAYVLGLIWADGNVCKDTFTLVLKECDKPLLEYVKKSIQSTGPLGYRKAGTGKISRKPAWVLRVHDQSFCNGLRAIGVIERKTSKLSFPKFLSASLYRPFILGVMDGDGCVRHGTYDSFTWTLSFAGSLYMMNDLSQILSNISSNKATVQKDKRSDGYSISYSGSMALKILNWLYSKPPPFFMRRKFDKYRYIVKTLSNPSKVKWRSTKDQIAIAEKIISHVS